MEYNCTFLVNNWIEQSAVFVDLYALSINGVFNCKLLEIGVFPGFNWNKKQSALGMHFLQSL